MSEARLHVSDSQGRRVVVLDRPQFLIGRRTAADLQIVSTDASREHAESIHRDEVRRCREMSAHAATLLQPGTKFCTECGHRQA